MLKVVAEEGAAPDVDLDEVLREAMVGCRRAEDALYEQGLREFRSLERLLGSMALAIEARLAARAR